MPAKSPRKYYKELRLQQLRSFCEAAQYKSLAGAATALGLSRPAVWQQVRALEREFGADLLRRSGRGVELTDAGRLLLELASPLVTGFDSIKAAFQDQRDDLVRSLSVAAPASVLANELSPCVVEFRRRHPSVILTLRDCTSRQAMRLVETGDADLAVIGCVEDEPHSRLLEYESLRQYPFLLVCSPKHELAQRNRINLSVLASYPMILMGEDSVTRGRAERVFESHGLRNRLNVVLSSTNDQLIADYVALGLGITVSPMDPTSKSCRALHVRDVTRWFGHETYALVHKRGTVEPAHTQTFRRLILHALAPA